MTPQEYLPLAQRTEKMYDTVLLRLNHAALGLGSEAGELFDNGVDYLEELGDFCWYIAIPFNAFGLSIDEIPVLVPVSWRHHLEQVVVHTGQFVGLVKKCMIYAQPVEQHQVEMMSRMYQALANIRAVCNFDKFTLEEVMSHNIAKLRERYPQKYTDAAAAARADKA